MVISVGDSRGVRQSIVAATAGAVATEKSRKLAKPDLIVIAALKQGTGLAPSLPAPGSLVQSFDAAVRKVFTRNCGGGLGPALLGTKNGGLTPVPCPHRRGPSAQAVACGQSGCLLAV